MGRDSVASSRGDGQRPACRAAGEKEVVCRAAGSARWPRRRDGRVGRVDGGGGGRRSWRGEPRRSRGGCSRWTAAGEHGRELACARGGSGRRFDDDDEEGRTCGFRDFDLGIDGFRRDHKNRDTGSVIISGRGSYVDTHRWGLSLSLFELSSRTAVIEARLYSLSLQGVFGLLCTLLASQSRRDQPARILTSPPLAKVNLVPLTRHVAAMTSSVHSAASDGSDDPALDRALADFDPEAASSLNSPHAGTGRAPSPRGLKRPAGHAEVDYRDQHFYEPVKFGEFVSSPLPARCHPPFDGHGRTSVRLHGM